MSKEQGEGQSKESGRGRWASRLSHGRLGAQVNQGSENTLRGHEPGGVVYVNFVNKKVLDGGHDSENTLRHGRGNGPREGRNGLANDSQEPGGQRERSASERHEPGNLEYVHTGNNRALDTGPRTANRGIPPLERQTHVASVRAQEETAALRNGQTPRSSHASETQGTRPASYGEALRPLAATVRETGFEARHLPMRDLRETFLRAEPIAQSSLQTLAATAETIARAADHASQAAQSWITRNIHLPRTREEQSGVTVLGKKPSEVKVSVWPHPVFWGIHQHDVPDTKRIERSPRLGVPRKPLEYHGYKSADDAGGEYPVNTDLTRGQFTAMQFAMPDTAFAGTTPRLVARAEISLPPQYLRTPQDHANDKSFHAKGGVTYMLFEGYGGDYSLVRVDQKPVKGGGESDGFIRQRYLATEAEAVALTRALAGLNMLDRH